MNKGIFLFALLLAFVLASSGSAVEVGFSISNMQSEPSNGMKIGFTLTPITAPDYSGGNGDRSNRLFSTPAQDDIINATPVIPEQKDTTTTTTTSPPVIAPISQKEVEEINQGYNEKKSGNSFYIICFGLVFMLIIVFVFISLIKKKRT